MRKSLQDHNYKHTPDAQRTDAHTRQTTNIAARSHAHGVEGAKSQIAWGR